MIRFRLWGTDFSLPLLTLLTPLLALRFGARDHLPILFLSLGIHETAHLIAAKAMRVQITEIRLMPFGGSARMENPYNLSAARLIVTAAAGPIANLVPVILASAAAQWRILPTDIAETCVRTNLTMLLFNLLPVLPLDGGRILFALLRGHMRESSALQIGLWTGRLLCALLLLTAAAAYCESGKLNLSLLLAAVFILSSEKDEKNALVRSRAERFDRILHRTDVILPVRLFRMDAGTSMCDALEMLRPQESALFILTRDGYPCACADSRALIDYLLRGGAPNAAVDALPACRIPAETAFCGPIGTEVLP